MAERGAHLTGTNFMIPSIFEIAAQESLASTLDPAFRKILSFFALSNVDKYGWLLNWQDEAYALFNLALQNYYLNKYSASFSETFYGLKRVSSENGALTSRQKKLCLFFLVVYPYLREKLSTLCNQYKLEKVSGQLESPSIKNHLKLCATRGHDIVYATKEALSLYYYVSYIAGKTPHPTLLFQLLAMRLTYANPDEHVALSEILQKTKQGTFGLGDGFEVLQRVTTRCLEIGAFVLQFMQWWNQEHFGMSWTALPVPPPPSQMPKKFKGLCPVCNNPPRNHTALAVSGYVFCYQCILTSVKTNGKCPVTNYVAKEDDLVRLYIE